MKCLLNSRIRLPVAEILWLTACVTCLWQWCFSLEPCQSYRIYHFTQPISCEKIMLKITDFVNPSSFEKSITPWPTSAHFCKCWIKYYSSLSLGELLQRCSVWILTLTMGCFSQTLTQPPVRSIGVTSASILNRHLVEHQVENVLAPILSFIPFHLAKHSFPRAWAGLSHRVLSKNSRSTPG